MHLLQAIKTRVSVLAILSVIGIIGTLIGSYYAYQSYTDSQYKITIGPRLEGIYLHSNFGACHYGEDHDPSYGGGAYGRIQYVYRHRMLISNPSDRNVAISIIRHNDDITRSGRTYYGGIYISPNQDSNSTDLFGDPHYPLVVEPGGAIFGINSVYYTFYDTEDDLREGMADAYRHFIEGNKSGRVDDSGVWTIDAALEWVFTFTDGTELTWAPEWGPMTPQRLDAEIEECSPAMNWWLNEGV